MKKCNGCGALVEDDVNSCALCGTNAFSQVLENEQKPTTEISENSENTGVVENNAVPENFNDNGNIVAGVVGAFLFALVGAALYFVIYQIGVIAGISGLVMFVLANFGYGLFAKSKSKSSVASMVTAVIMTFFMIFVAEYSCLSYEIFTVYKSEGITIFDAVRATPVFLADPEILKPVLGDLGFAYVFAFAATIGNIVDFVKAKKKSGK